ncbi:MurR/RpiR family transcriptional regulator [Sagittula stellata]|uniref:MurR/RpiR family transcriptional regulator n=1 Tax=Sagittula stellata TaxID=52603 RepID=UPI00058B5977|nr:MurR/RpiR family transcriptional regulator [Sagittula stellata]
MTSSQDLLARLRNGAQSGAERKVAAALSETFPTGALGTVEVLANRAGVSGPTVLRYVNKLGFSRFADFQAAVMQELDRQLGSPAVQMATPSEPQDGGEHLYRRTLLMQAEALRRVADRAVPAEFDRIVDLLTDPKLTIRALGGRYSRNLAQRLVLHLGQVRTQVSLIERPLGFAFDPLVDIGPRDLLVVFDYRRYQQDLMAFAKAAWGQGARIVLLTDLSRSPVAELAEAVLISPDESPSPFASRVVATAQVEALVAAVVARDRDAARRRLERIEALRRDGQGDA